MESPGFTNPGGVVDISPFSVAEGDVHVRFLGVRQKRHARRLQRRIQQRLHLSQGGHACCLHRQALKTLPLSESGYAQPGRLCASTASNPCQHCHCRPISNEALPHQTLLSNTLLGVPAITHTRGGGGSYSASACFSLPCLSRECLLFFNRAIM